MDVFSRVIYGTRIDIPIALLCTFIAIAVGWPTGVLAGYFRTTIAELYMRFLDTIHSFPLFILALAIMALAGPSRGKIVHVDRRSGDITQSWASIEKARKVLSYAPQVELRQGLKTLVSSYHMNIGPPARPSSSLFSK